MNGFLIINSLDKERKASFHERGFSFKGRVLLMAYKELVCYHCEDMIHSVSQKSLCIYTAIRNIPQIELSCVFANKTMHVHTYLQAQGGPFLTPVITRVNGEMYFIMYSLNKLIMYAVTFDSSCKWHGQLMRKFFTQGF